MVSTLTLRRCTCTRGDNTVHDFIPENGRFFVEPNRRSQISPDHLGCHYQRTTRSPKAFNPRTYRLSGKSGATAGCVRSQNHRCAPISLGALWCCMHAPRRIKLSPHLPTRRRRENTPLSRISFDPIPLQPAHSDPQYLTHNQCMLSNFIFPACHTLESDFKATTKSFLSHGVFRYKFDE